MKFIFTLLCIPLTISRATSVENDEEIHPDNLSCDKDFSSEGENYKYKIDHDVFESFEFTEKI